MDEITFKLLERKEIVHISSLKNEFCPKKFPMKKTLLSNYGFIKDFNSLMKTNSHLRTFFDKNYIFVLSDISLKKKNN